MKKFFLLLMAVGAITLVSCDNKAKSSSASESEASESESCESKSCKSECSESTDKNEKEEAVNGVKYENKDFGYSVVLPEGFKQQNNDAEMEKDRGGKLFLGGDGCTIDVTCSEMNYIGDTTPEASIDQSIEMVKALNEGAEVEKLDAVSFVSKSQDENYLRSQYEAQKNGKKYLIYFTYPIDKKEQFDKDVDAVVKSVKM